MRTRLTAAALTAAALIALTACSSDGDDAKSKTTPTAIGATTTAAGKVTPSVDMSSIEAAAGFPAEPTGAKRTAYLAAIKAVDQSLVTDPDKAIRNGRNQCQAINGGSKNLDHQAAERFGTGSHALGDDQGKLINAALKLTLCPPKN